MAAAVPYIIMAVGTALQMQGEEKKRKANQAIANTRASQLEEEADQAIAVSQQEAGEEKRKKSFIASRAIALMAASGASASDPTAVKIMADIEGEGAYRQSVALYKGEEEARRIRKGAEVVRKGGEYQAEASKIRQTAIGVKGASSMYGTYARSSYG